MNGPDDAPNEDDSDAPLNEVEIKQMEEAQKTTLKTFYMVKDEVANEQAREDDGLSDDDSSPKSENPNSGTIKSYVSVEANELNEEVKTDVDQKTNIEAMKQKIIDSDL